MRFDDNAWFGYFFLAPTLVGNGAVIGTHLLGGKR